MLMWGQQEPCLNQSFTEQVKLVVGQGGKSSSININTVTFFLLSTATANSCLLGQECWIYLCNARGTRLVT